MSDSRSSGTPWRLYGTAGCHLCEQAAALLTGAGIAFVAIDIADDEALLSEMALTIPVVRTPSDHTRCWPFTAADLAQLQASDP